MSATYDALPHAATLDIQEALAEVERSSSEALRKAHDEIAEAHAKLRQRMQVVCMGGDPGTIDAD